MAYGATSLYLTGGAAPGFNQYTYQTSDTMATVLPLHGSGYFTFAPGSVHGPKLVAGDRIFCQCSDGNMWLKVSAVSASTGAVTCQYAGGNLPIRTWATGTAAGDFGGGPGYYEVGTSIASGTRMVLGVPYAGAEYKFMKVDSGTETFAIDAGGSAPISWGDGGTAGGGTANTFDGSNRRMLLRAEGDWFHVVASSSSRWRVHGYNFSGSAVSEGASVEMPGT